MSPTRAQKQTTMSELEAHRRAARGALLGVLEALRVGRLRVVDPHPASSAFRPRMEVYNDPDSPNIVATFELPGVKNSDVSISVKQGMLLIQGQRHPRYRASRVHPSLRGQPQAEVGDMDVDPSQASRARAEADSRYFPFQELRYGSFRRSLRLPSGADTSSITASLSDGLLTVSWPRGRVGKQVDQSPISVTGAERSSVEHPTSAVRAVPRGTTSDAPVHMDDSQ